MALWLRNMHLNLISQIGCAAGLHAQLAYRIRYLKPTYLHSKYSTNPLLYKLLKVTISYLLSNPIERHQYLDDSHERDQPAEECAQVPRCPGGHPPARWCILHEFVH